ncbi:MAG: cytochrome c maturation protein CcmE [Planctomycetes bacterium]|nr:cytochrome c maturation protein CcmE [Planctomycetota bacterium]NOG54130.1 cytochrome c maturation protein CcmE [Planctomycetota bacterium]
MNQVQIKMLIAGVLVAGAVTFLAIAGLKGGGFTYYLSVEEFLADETKYDQRVRLHGIVQTEDFASNPGLMSAEFTLATETASIRVNYAGTIPDMFQANREVVIEGMYDAQGNVFNADVLMTKCASKYQEEGMPADVPEDGRVTDDSDVPAQDTDTTPGGNDQ